MTESSCLVKFPISASKEPTYRLQCSSFWWLRVTVWFYFELSTSAIFPRSWISSFFNLNDISLPWPYMAYNTTCNKHILVSNALIHEWWIIIITDSTDVFVLSNISVDIKSHTWLPHGLQHFSHRFGCFSCLCSPKCFAYLCIIPDHLVYVWCEIFQI